MFFSHFIKMIEYLSSLPPIKIEQLPSVAVACVQYLSKVMPLYIAVFFS